MKKITGGLYFLYDKGQLVYIGKSSNIFQRIGSHIHENVKEFDSWEYQVIEDEKERSNMEGYLIRIFNPKYNEKGEPNDIFDKNKNEQLDLTLHDVIRNYEVLHNYDYIPLTLLDDVFGIDHIGVDLYFNGIIPQEKVNQIRVYGYTKGCFVEKSYVLENIDKIVNYIRNKEKI